MSKIENLVISGGGPNGLIAYGAVQQLAVKQIWSLHQLKHIYATSFGAIISVMIVLGYEWDDLNDYIVKRPWEKIIQLDFKNYINAISECGLIIDGFCRKALTPLLEAKDIDVNVTLKDFCKHVNVKLHFFTVNVNGSPLDLFELNSDTDDTLTLIQAIEMTTAVPIVFPPVFYRDKCLIDGGIICNYPVQQALLNDEVALENTFGVYMRFDDDHVPVTAEGNIFELVSHTFKKMIKHIGIQNASTGILKYEICCTVGGEGGFGVWDNIMKSSETRSELIQKGRDYANPLIDRLLISTSSSSSEETE